MDSRDTPESSTGGVGVRVLLPDGGQMEEPEEEGDAGDEEESSEEQTDGEEEQTDAESEDEESESAEGDEQEVEGEDEGDEEQAEDDQEEEAAEDEEAEAGEGEEDESEEEAEAEGEEAEGEGEGEEAEEESEREKAVSDEGARLLHLNIDGLFLDLLGLEVDLDTVTLDLTAVEGESKLLGNLLSAVSGLLGGDPLSGLLPEMPDNPLSGLLGGEGDEEGEEGESEGSGLLPDVHPMQRAKELAGYIADGIRSAIDDAGSSIISALPLEELLAQFLQEVVNQLLDTSDDGDEADAEEAAASA